MKGEEDTGMSSHERAADALRDFYLRSHRVVDRIMTARGASFARAKMLAHIAREGALRSADLAVALDYAPRTVTEAIDGLERDGLARREPDPEDRRAKRISLTPAGIAAAEAAGA
jgi:DNA-binding MarR family transcriptional regulator